MIFTSWIFIFVITLPPLLKLGVSYGLEPHGTCCTWDYWNHKGELSVKIYLAVLSLTCFAAPIGFNIILTGLTKDHIKEIMTKHERYIIKFPLKCDSTSLFTKSEALYSTNICNAFFQKREKRVSSCTPDSKS